VKSISINGQLGETKIINEHLIIPKCHTKKGLNVISIEFIAGEQSLNRREQFLYTLLVPDRARTLFPCFDQPDLKARYTLSLSIPEGWRGISNTSVRADDGKTIAFEETEPLSTYLFSFVAGKFECVTQEEIGIKGCPIHLYHRETDQNRLAQCTEILRQVKESINWLEEYTGVKYPFAKYDLVILPDFQYGGMEHTGATLYNDKRMFLDGNPTTDELLRRALLIAHETAHMWFGDYVTMKWFNDVWTKEVFANFFAAKMVQPLFPEVNHELNDMKNYYATAYEEDRTIGSNAIQRNLDNLQDAGLIYCNIIYDKSPVIMSILERRLGTEVFRSGIREYLKSYAFGNATWDALVEIFNRSASFDVPEWSRVWIKERGMPKYSFVVDKSNVIIRQSDSFGNGNIWQQDIVFTLVSEYGETRDVTAVFNGSTEVVVNAPFAVVHVIPNSDGKGYGWFKISEEDEKWLESVAATSDNTNTRMSILMTLYENTWHGVLNAENFIKWLCGVIPNEHDMLIRSSMINYAKSADLWAGRTQEFEVFLQRVAADSNADSELRIQAFRCLISTCSKYSDLMLEIWRDERPFKGLKLSEGDYTSLAYQLMLKYPSMASEIRRVQADRITNPDRKEAFLYISQACSEDHTKRNEFFNSLLSASTRGPESRVTNALSLLVSDIHPEEAISRIRPSLEVIEDIQRTGDIFFPSTWCSSLLGGQISQEAACQVRNYVDTHSDLNPLLMTKILQKGGWLLQVKPSN